MLQRKEWCSLALLVLPTARSHYSSGASIVSVARYSACEMAWYIREQRVVARSVVPVAAIVPVFPAGTNRPRVIEGPQKPHPSTADMTTRIMHHIIQIIGLVGLCETQKGLSTIGGEWMPGSSGQKREETQHTNTNKSRQP